MQDNLLYSRVNLLDFQLYAIKINKTKKYKHNNLYLNILHKI